MEVEDVTVHLDHEAAMRMVNFRGDAARLLEITQEAIGVPILIEATSMGQSVIWTPRNGWEKVDGSHNGQAANDPLIGKRVVTKFKSDLAIQGYGSISNVSSRGDEEIATCDFSANSGEVLSRKLRFDDITILPDLIVATGADEGGMEYSADITAEFLDLSAEEMAALADGHPEKLPKSIRAKLPKTAKSVSLIKSAVEYLGGTISNSKTGKDIKMPEKLIKLASENLDQCKERRHPQLAHENTSSVKAR